MRTRRLGTEERILTRPLYESVFPEDSPAFVDYYYTDKTADNEIYVIEKNGAIRSMLHLNPYTLIVNGQAVPAHYIVAVGTQKSFRGRGFMTALIRQALKDMEKAGEPFTFLMPAAEEIYLPHDFRTVYTQKRHMYTPASERSAVSQGMTVRKAAEADAEELAEFAGDLLGKEYQVYALRTREYYERLIREYASDGGYFVLYEIEGVPVDCRIYLPENETHGKAGEDPVIMTRPVNVPRLLALLSADGPMDLCFTVTDPILEENCQCLRLTWTADTGMQVSEAEPADSGGEIPVAALGEFVFGADTVDELAQQEGVSLSGRMQEELKKIRPLSRIFLNEVV